MKKVLIFSLAYYPNNVSGAEAAVREITDRINPNDIEFHMVTLRYNSELAHTEKIGNVLVHRIGLVKKNPSFQELGKLPLDLNKPLYQFQAASKASSLHKKYKYDAIWAMMAHSAGVPAALFKLKHPRIPYLLTLQEGDPTDYIEKKMRPLGILFKRAFSQADIVQSISEHLASWARRQGVSDEKITIIHNGANPRDIAATTSESELNQLKQKLGKKENEVWLVNTARLVPQKANDDTIRALAKLPQNIRLLLVGDGPENDKLRQLAQSLKIDNRLIMTGPVDRSEVTKYRQISNIFVSPSRSEGLGNAFLSAMASGLPVVATQSGGLSEFIFDAKHNPSQKPTAWVVDKNSPDQIATAIEDILTNPSKVKTITKQARDMVMKHYNWDLIAQQMQRDIFLKIL